jgi:NADH:ubiquinone oxidoreductase subunit 5 (subunit L)/multisubunit Na+/H+ antiporter MnhA subunit
MLSLLTIFSFFPIFLVTHCVFIVLFKKNLGPIGTFYGSLLAFTVCFSLSLNELYVILVQGNYYYIDFGRWFFCLDLIDSHLTFCVDSLALTAATLVLALTVLALYFGAEYMYREAHINRLLYLLNLFATSVILLFFCYDYFLILLIWECIGLFSFLLVNFYSTRVYTIKAALKTFVFSRISDMFMFTAFILTIVVFNTTDLSVIFLQTPFMAFHYLFIGDYAIHFLSFFAFCLVTSGVIKAAQFGAHVWLPDAMEAPTPASALIHSSTLVVAGVFLIIRFSVLFEFTLFVNYYLALLGAITLAFGAWSAVYQTDIKKLVAYSTISQIGYLVCGCGFCCYEEVLIYLIIHALNKAFLFILVGYTVHFFNGNTDMREMGGNYIYSFDVAVLVSVLTLNLAGIPYSAGFIGKELLLIQLLRSDTLSLIVRGCWLISLFASPIYMSKLVVMACFGTKRGVSTTYLGGWQTNFHKQFQTLVNFWVVKKGSNRVDYYMKNQLIYYYQYTSLNSKLTAIVLFTYYFIMTLFGEFLLLMTLNFNTLTDLIPSHYFVATKTHTLFWLDNGSTAVNEAIFSLILFFLVIAAHQTANWLSPLPEFRNAYLKDLHWFTLIFLWALYSDFEVISWITTLLL